MKLYQGCSDMQNMEILLHVYLLLRTIQSGCFSEIYHQNIHNQQYTTIEQKQIVPVAFLINSSEF